MRIKNLDLHASLVMIAVTGAGNSISTRANTSCIRLSTTVQNTKISTYRYNIKGHCHFPIQYRCSALLKIPHPPLFRIRHSPCAPLSLSFLMSHNQRKHHLEIPGFGSLSFLFYLGALRVYKLTTRLRFMGDGLMILEPPIVAQSNILSRLETIPRTS